MSDGRRILITGGAGFLGYHLARRLAAEADSTIDLVDNLVRGRRDAEMEALIGQPNVHLIEGDLTDPETLTRLQPPYHEVYHLAAIIGVEHVLERPAEVIRVGGLATLLLLDWLCRGGGEKLVFSSTSEAYAWTQDLHPLPIPTPEEVPLALTDLKNPRASYAGSKIFGELAITQTCRAHDKPFALLRYHNVYGPRMGWKHVIPQLAERAAGGESPLTVYSPHHRRAFCFVDDAVEATVRAMRWPEANGETFNVGNDTEEVPIEDLAHRVLDHLGLDNALAAKPAANDPISRRCPDVTKARRVLGYEPQVSLDEGLRQTLAWYREHPRPE